MEDVYRLLDPPPAGRELGEGGVKDVHLRRPVDGHERPLLESAPPTLQVRVRVDLAGRARVLVERLGSHLARNGLPGEEGDTQQIKMGTDLFGTMQRAPLKGRAQEDVARLLLLAGFTSGSDGAALSQAYKDLEESPIWKRVNGSGFVFCMRH